MAQETVDQILARKAAERAAAAEKNAVPETAPAAPTAEPDLKEEDKFFSIRIGDGMQENFIELQTRDGLRTCFPYSDIIWIVYDPDNGLNIEIGGYLVTIEGRGLVPRLFEGIKQKRVAWIKEADHELQDHKDNDTFISTITITPPKGFTEEDETPTA